MKIKYLKLKNWLLVSLGSLVGLPVGCALPLEYGCPEATYHVKGTVVDEEGQPIAGIGVGRMYFSDGNERDQGWNYLDTTDVEGFFNTTFNRYSAFIDTLYVNFDDIEWNNNGYYRDTVISVSFVGAHFTGGDGNWYEGEATRTINVTLHRIDK